MKYELDFWKPLPIAKEFEALQRNINHMFNDVFQTGRTKGTESMFTPTCDVEETDGAYKLMFDLPGVKKEDIKIDLAENVLTVSGERKEERTEEKNSKKIYERTYGRFERSFQLPATIEADRVEAHYDKGVLQLVLPKSEMARPKQIPVREGATTQALNRLSVKKDERPATKGEKHAV